MSDTRSRRKAELALMAALLPALSGCKLLGIGQASLASNASLHERLPDDFGAQQLAEGRKALADGHVADAIESFQLAGLYPAQAAAAANGLAVAWSRAGRSDLTERYFRQAIALAPQDDRYRSNLALFYSRNPIPRSADPNAPMLAMQDAAPIAFGPAEVVGASLEVPQDRAEPTVSRPAPARALAGGISVRPGGATVQRISRTQVHIGTAGPAAAQLAVRRERQAVIEVGARGGTPAPAAPGAARVTFSGPRPAYPVRIEFDRN